MNGTNVLILVNTGSDVSPTWTAVGSQRGASIKETNDEIDMSSKNQREKRVLAGRYSATLSLDALYVPDDTAYLALKTAMRAGDLIMIHTEEEGVEMEEASAIITNMSSDFPDQGPATITIDLSVDGAWSAVGS